MADSAPATSPQRQSAAAHHCIGMRRGGAPGAPSPSRLLLACTAFSSLLLHVYADVTPSKFSPSQETQLYVVCKDLNSKVCITWPMVTENVGEKTNEVSLSMVAGRLCGLSDLKPIPPHKKMISVKPFKSQKMTFCNIRNVISYVAVNLAHMPNAYKTLHRKRRQSGYIPRGRYRGQTQSQYLAIDGGTGKDEGKAEAHSAADSSRASVSGNSGMGQAQSQTVYDPSCDECFGRGDLDAANLSRKPGYNNGQGHQGGNGGHGTTDGSTAGRPGIWNNQGNAPHGGNGRYDTSQGGPNGKTVTMPGGQDDIFNKPGRRVDMPFIHSQDGSGAMPDHTRGSNPVSGGGDIGSIPGQKPINYYTPEQPGGNRGLQPSNQGGIHGGTTYPTSNGNFIQYRPVHRPSNGEQNRNYDNGQSMPNKNEISGGQPTQNGPGIISPPTKPLYTPNQGGVPNNVMGPPRTISDGSMIPQTSGGSNGIQTNIGTGQGSTGANWPSSGFVRGADGLLYFCCAVKPDQQQYLPPSGWPGGTPSTGGQQIPGTNVQQIGGMSYIPGTIGQQTGGGSYIPGTGGQQTPSGTYIPGTGGQQTGGGSYIPGAGGQQPGGGSYIPGSGGQQTGGGPYIPGTGGQQTGGGSYIPGTGGQQTGGGSYIPGTGGQQSGGGSFIPGAGGQQPGGGSYIPGTGGQQTGGGSYIPGTGGQQTGGGSYIPSTNGQQPGGGSYIPGTGGQQTGGGGSYIPGTGGQQNGGGSYIPGAGGQQSGGGSYIPGPGGQQPGGGSYIPGSDGQQTGGGSYIPGTGGQQTGGGSYIPGAGGQQPGGGSYIPGSGGQQTGGGSYIPGAGGQQPGGGSYIPGSGGQQTGGGSYIPGTGGQQTGGGSYIPGAGGQQPGGGSYIPGAGGKQPGGGSYIPGSGGQQTGGGSYIPGTGGQQTGGGSYIPGTGGQQTGGGSYIPGTGGTYLPGTGGQQTGGGSYIPGAGGQQTPGGTYMPGTGGQQTGGGSYIPGTGGTYMPGTGGQQTGGGSYIPGTGGQQTPGGTYMPGTGGQQTGGGSYIPGTGGQQTPGGTYMPGTGGQQTGGGSYIPGTGGQQSPGGTYMPGTGGQQTGDGSYIPGAGGQQPGSGSYIPGTGGQQTPGGLYVPGTGGQQTGGGSYMSGTGGQQTPGGTYMPGTGGGTYMPGTGAQTGGQQIPSGPYIPGSGSQQPGGGSYTPGAGGQQTGGGSYIPGTSGQQIPSGSYVPGSGGQQTGGGPQGSGADGQHGGTGEPQNVLDPNSIITEDDDSQALASVYQRSNGTTASASSSGGNAKGRAQTNVQGSYTNSGEFSAQASISDDNKGAESQVSGSKKGATSNAEGRGRKNKSQAAVKLGSETGSIQTDSQSSGTMHSSNTQVQGSVKGGIADAQARGPGSTSSQAQIGFTPYKQGDKAHELLKKPFEGGGTASAQSTGRMGTSQSQLRGTFKYGITYNGAAQAGSSLDKDAVFSNLIPFEKINVFDENNTNINVNIANTDSPSMESAPTNKPIDADRVTEKEEEILKDPEDQFSDHTHFDHHKTNDEPNTSGVPPLAGNRRAFQPAYGNNNGADYEYNIDDNPAEEYDIDDVPDGTDNMPGEQGEYTNYDNYARETEDTHQAQRSNSRKGLDVKQTTGGNTQHILIGSLKNQDAKITQIKSERPEEGRIYQPGERVPGMGGYTIPVGFTGSVKSVASKEKTYVVGSRNSPSQAQTVTLTPGTGRVKYVKPDRYSKNVNSKDLRSLHNPRPDDNRYVSVSKSVTRDLDSENNIRKQYSHTYYTKSSSCGYFTFTCTMVSSAEGKKKVCRPKIPTNPDGSPMRC